MYSTGPAHYWEQFQGLLERLLGSNRFIDQRMAQWGDVCNVGMIDDDTAARGAAEKFNAANVDMIFVVPILKIGKTMTHVKFVEGSAPTVNQRFALAPAHHAAMSVGHNADDIRRVATLTGIVPYSVSRQSESLAG